MRLALIAAAAAIALAGATAPASAGSKAKKPERRDNYVAEYLAYMAKHHPRQMQAVIRAAERKACPVLIIPPKKADSVPSC